MALWGSNTAAKASAPKFVTVTGARGNAYGSNVVYANSGVGAIQQGTLKTVNGQIANSTTAHGTHAGWRVVTVGTGPLATLTIQAGSSGYTNGDLLRVTSPANSLNGGVNASAVATTNATGGLVSFAVSTYGAGFINATPAFAMTNSTAGTTSGTGANVTFTVGGRAGRTQSEVLVAAGSFT